MVAAGFALWRVHLQQVGPQHRLNLIEFAPNQIEFELDEGGGKLEPETL